MLFRTHNGRIARSAAVLTVAASLGAATVPAEAFACQWANMTYVVSPAPNAASLPANAVFVVADNSNPIPTFELELQSDAGWRTVPAAVFDEQIAGTMKKYRIDPTDPLVIGATYRVARLSAENIRTAVASFVVSAAADTAVPHAPEVIAKIFPYKARGCLINSCIAYETGVAVLEWNAGDDTLLAEVSAGGQVIAGSIGSRAQVHFQCGEHPPGSFYLSDGFILPAGQHTLSMRFVDTAGNFSEPASLTLNLICTKDESFDGGACTAPMDAGTTHVGDAGNGGNPDDREQVDAGHNEGPGESGGCTGTPGVISSLAVLSILGAVTRRRRR